MPSDKGVNNTLTKTALFRILQHRIRLPLPDNQHPTTKRMPSVDTFYCSWLPNRGESSFEAELQLLKMPNWWDFLFELPNAPHHLQLRTMKLSTFHNHLAIDVSGISELPPIHPVALGARTTHSGTAWSPPTFEMVQYPTVSCILCINCRCSQVYLTSCGSEWVIKATKKEKTKYSQSVAVVVLLRHLSAGRNFKTVLLGVCITRVQGKSCMEPIVIQQGKKKMEERNDIYPSGGFTPYPVESNGLVYNRAPRIYSVPPETFSNTVSV